MLLRLSHTTTYVYSAPVSLSPHLLYLRPRGSAALHLRSYELHTEPAARLQEVRDPLDNDTTCAHFHAPLTTVTFAMRAEVKTHDTNPFDFTLKDYAIPYPFTYEPVFDFALGPCLAPPYADTQSALRTWLNRHFTDRPRESVPFLSALNSLIFNTLKYERRERVGIQPSRETIQRGTGACRDYAVLMMELCRTLGLAARFVSGYLYTPPDDDQRTANAMHAWVEVYLPGAGWKGLDPTHGIWCNDAFVPVAHAAQAESVNPIQGNLYAKAPVTAKLDTTVTVDLLDGN